MDNLSLIAAIGKNNELGLDNKLLWHISEDLKFYKNITMNHNIIMGRKTLESMPPSALKGRNPIVLTSHDLSLLCDVLTFSNINDLLDYIDKTNEEFIVVGGASIYREFLPYVDVMYLTEVLEEYEADSYFPAIKKEEWDIEMLDDYSNEEIPYIRNKYVRRKVK